MVRAADRVMTVRGIDRKITKKKAPPGGFKNVQEMPSSSNVCQAAHDKCQALSSLETVREGDDDTKIPIFVFD